MNIFPETISFKWLFSYIVLPLTATISIASSAESQSRTNSSSEPAPTKLYGRIEQLTDTTSGEPELDLGLVENNKNSAPSSSGDILKGKVVESYPVDWAGNWGGRIEIRNTGSSQAYASAHSQEAEYEKLAFVPGLVGNVNLNFTRAGSELALDPPRALFLIPLAASILGKHAREQLGLGHAFHLRQTIDDDYGPDAIKQIDVTKENFNNQWVGLNLRFDQSGQHQTTLDGRNMRQQVMRNVLRKIDNLTYEQDIVSKQFTDKRRNGMQSVIDAVMAGKHGAVYRSPRNGEAETPELSYSEIVSGLHLEPDGQTLKFRLLDTRYDEMGKYARQWEFEGQVKRGVLADTRIRRYGESGYLEPNKHP